MIATDWILAIELLLSNSDNGIITKITAQNPRINLLGSSSKVKFRYEYFEMTIVIESKTVEYKPIIANASKTNAIRYSGKVFINVKITCEYDLPLFTSWTALTR